MTDNKSLSYLMDIDKVNKEKFSQVISDIENLKTEVSNIKSKVDSSLPVDISSVNTSISDVKNDISGISTKVGGISDIKTDTEKIISDVSSINGNISTVKDEMGGFVSWFPKYRVATINKKSVSSVSISKGQSKQLISISGKGHIAAIVLYFQGWTDYIINIDGKETRIMYGGGYSNGYNILSSSASYISGSTITTPVSIGSDRDSFGTLSLTSTKVANLSQSDFFTGGSFEISTDTSRNNNGVLISPSIEFSYVFSIYGTPGSSSSGSASFSSELYYIMG